MKNCYLALLLIVCGSLPALAQQKYCDLEISISSPLEGQVFPHGDTANVDYVIKNLGPDTLDLTDTIYFTVAGLPFTSSIEENLLPGDSVTSTILKAFRDVPLNDTQEFCLYIVQERNETISDTVATNDTACIQFILEGSPTSIDLVKKNKSASLRLFPNPASQKVVLDVVDYDPGKGRIIISDISGKEWRRLDVQAKGGTSNLKVDLDISNLPMGIYFLEFVSSGTRTVNKLVVQ